MICYAGVKDLVPSKENLLIPLFAVQKSSPLLSSFNDLHFTVEYCRCLASMSEMCIWKIECFCVDWGKAWHTTSPC